MLLAGRPLSLGLQGYSTLRASGYYLRLPPRSVLGPSPACKARHELSAPELRWAVIERRFGLEGSSRACSICSSSAAMPGVWARVAPGRNLGQPAEVMGPAFRMTGALLGIGQAGVGEAHQRSVRLLDQIYLDQA